MLSVNYMGRIGNQLFQYATLYAAGKRTGYEIASKKWIGSEVFNLPFTEEEIPCDHELREAGIGTPHHQLPGTTDSTYNEILHIKDNTRLYGFFQSEIYFKEYREDILKLFSLKESLSSLVKEKISFLDDRPLVCIHHRAIVGKTGPFDAPQTCIVGDPYYFNALNELCEKTGKKPEDFNYLLISNDPNTQVLSLLPNLTKSDQVFSDTGPSTSAERNIIDLFLMANADYCITAASSYSWWGAWLNQKAEWIFAPARLNNHHRQFPEFNGEEKPDKCIPKHWVKIG